MKGDSIIVEEHHRKAAEGVVPVLLPLLQTSNKRYTVSVAGQSGAGKSETTKLRTKTEQLQPLRHRKEP